MHRVVLLTLGGLELLIAAVVGVLAYQLPGTDDVQKSFGRVEGVTRRSGDHVRLLRRQLHDLRRPELQELAARLEKETRTVTANLRDQQIDFETAGTMSTALGDVSTGLDGLARTFDAEGVGKLGEGLGTAADYLEKKVAPRAAQAAGRLEETTKQLAVDADRLCKILREAPPDLKAAREIHDSLGRFGEGLDRMHTSLKADRLETMREGFKGLEGSLNTGADQVARLSGYTYPVVTIDRLRPVVDQKKFWPEGDQIADGMRKAAKGVTAAKEELDALAAEVPKLRGSLEESRKVAEKTREALGQALRHQDKLETLLQDVPRHSARLAEELPKLGGDLARVLRDTQRLKEVGAALREAQKSLDAAVARWPDLRTTLSRSATVLKALQGQLQQTLERRREYEAALRQTVALAEAFATLLPLFTTQMDRRLAEQEQALDDLGRGIDEVEMVLPAYAQATSRVAGTARLLLALVAVLVGLHAAYVLVGARAVRSAAGS